MSHNEFSATIMFTYLIMRLLLHGMPVCMSYILACVELIMITSTQSYNCAHAHIAQDCPLENLIQTQLQDKNGVTQYDHLIIETCTFTLCLL